MLKHCKVVMLPTNEKAGIGCIYKRTVEDLFDDGLPANKIGDLIVNQNPLVNKTNDKFEAQHLYITVAESPKIGDWGLASKESQPFRVEVQDLKIIESFDGYQAIKFTTIIASTDPTLNLPSPSKAFIEKFCEKNGIEEVGVEYEMNVLCDSYILSIRNDNTIITKPFQKTFTRLEMMYHLSKLEVSGLSAEEYIEKYLLTID